MRLFKKRIRKPRYMVIVRTILLYANITGFLIYVLLQVKTVYVENHPEPGKSSFYY